MAEASGRISAADGAGKGKAFRKERAVVNRRSVQREREPKGGGGEEGAA